MTREDWIRAHEYLEPIAAFCAEVEDALAGVQTSEPSVPRWDDHAADFASGVPLLNGITIDLEPVEPMVAGLLDKLCSGKSDLAAQARALKAELQLAPESSRVSRWLLGEDALAPSAPGLLRFIGWRTMARYLQPVIEAFAEWRDEDRWLRSYCPTCGSGPAMAQLIGVDPGRKRFLACGCCGTRWRRSRTACPFCEGDSHRTGIVTIEGEARLRIDYCESCRGYLKTYDGTGEESVMLADWTSLHLDVIAHDRGLKRSATSLYEFEPLLQPARK